jgi:uncharacterized protein (TIGR02145 family)
LNVGTRINGTESPTNNGLGSGIEKYCYGDNETNCTNNYNGGLYQWNEAMNYSTVEGAQGICPANSHIPTDAEWKTLEMYLGMSQAQADATGWRGTNQGTQLKNSGASGLNIPLAGNRLTNDTFYNLSSDANLWFSSESGANAWFRSLNLGLTTVNRGTYDKAFGFSVRCLGN